MIKKVVYSHLVLIKVVMVLIVTLFTLGTNNILSFHKGSIYLISTSNNTISDAINDVFSVDSVKYKTYNYNGETYYKVYYYTNNNIIHFAECNYTDFILITATSSYLGADITRQTNYTFEVYLLLFLFVVTFPTKKIVYYAI